MLFQWLKRYMPRSLYARAALILVLPVVTLQLVVSVVFIQRHFEGVTRYMTSAVALELALILEEAEQAPSRDQMEEQVARLAQSLEIDLTLAQSMDHALLRRWYDFSGTVVNRILTSKLPQVVAIQLPDDNVVNLWATTENGPVKLSFDRSRVSASNPHQLLVNMVVFGVIMTVVAFIYLRNQLRPVTRLAHAAEAFGRGRHEDYTPGGAVEVRAAGNAFLDMRARIERQIEQRTMMLSGVSHDLRTPLTRLKLGLSFLSDEERAPLEQDVADMQRLLDEFLSFARGAQEGEMEEVDPHELVQEVVENCKRAQLPVTLREAEGQGVAHLRRVNVQRAIENLINNAVRYGSRAEVSVRIGEKSLRIRIEDDGPGIPAEARDDAVKPFVRLDPSRNQDKGSGVGLGLAIAADVARAHGGVLRLGESDTLGGLQADIVLSVSK